MLIEPIPFRPKVERRREILYGTPGVTIYKDDRRFIWIPEEFCSLTKNLSSQDLEALAKELKRYLGSGSLDGRVD